MDACRIFLLISFVIVVDASFFTKSKSKGMRRIANQKRKKNIHLTSAAFYAVRTHTPWPFYVAILL